MSEQDNPDSKQKTVTSGRDDSSNPTGLLQLDQNLINLQDVHQQLVDSSKNQHSVEDSDLNGERIKKLEEVNRQMCMSFNTQRAKMKELYVQTERERDELKTQLVLLEMKTQEEITSLHQIVQDKIDETDVFKTELEHLKAENINLRQENHELKETAGQKHQRHSPEFSTLGPQMLGQVKRTLTRKLVGDNSQINSINSPPAHSPSSTLEPTSPMYSNVIHDVTEDHKVKGEQNTTFANEDPEVLSSLVTHLQEEREVLKEKLREADERLQTSKTKEEQNGKEINSYSKDKNKTDDKLITLGNQMEIPLLCKVQTDSAPDCETCNKLKQELEIKARKILNLEKQLSKLDQDLTREATLRHDLENEWQENREAYKTEVHVLREQIGVNEKKLLELQQRFLETKEETLRQLQKVCDGREQVNRHLEILQADNDYLSGRYLQTADEIQNQEINLPGTVVELQELVLQYQQEVIKARLGCEYERKLRLQLSDEMKILREQMEAHSCEYNNYKKMSQTKMKSLQDRITEHLMTQQQVETAKTALERREVELNRQISISRSEIIQVQEENEKLKKFLSEAKTKTKILQDELATSEEVQKDFVLLSQELQMALEQLRKADAEVRWQDDDDICNCPTCARNFTVTLRKIHCRHCGRIFCDDCLTKSIASGPRQRPARVCDICHTLLMPNTAPYFSQSSPTAASLSTATGVDSKH